jgi:hypothetical protein
MRSLTAFLARQRSLFAPSGAGQPRHSVTRYGRRSAIPAVGRKNIFPPYLAGIASSRPPPE